jgi:hypothetical protein
MENLTGIVSVRPMYRYYALVAVGLPNALDTFSIVRPAMTFLEVDLISKGNFSTLSDSIRFSRVGGTAAKFFMALSPL